MSLQQLKQLPHRPIMRNRIWHWHNSLEPEDPVLVAIHNTSTIRSLSIRMLNIVMSRTVRLPDINLHTLNWVPINILYCAEYEAGLSFGVVGHQLAIGDRLCFVGMEGPKDRSFGGRRRLRMVNCVDEEREAENIGEEDEFLSFSHVSI
jgi:hypothetical protein